MRRLLITAAALCGLVLVPVAGAATKAQWANDAAASSQYGTEAWSALQATGAPDVQGCADNSAAWAAEKAGTKAFIDLYYETPVTPTGVWVYQTLNPGAVTRVTAWDSDIKKSKVVYRATAKAGGKCPSTLKIRISGVRFKVAVLRVQIDQKPSGGWAEIDAVKLIGKP